MPHGKEKRAQRSLIEAARHFAGDAEQDATAMSEEEAAAVEGIRRKLKRPNTNEIIDEVKKLIGK